MNVNNFQRHLISLRFSLDLDAPLGYIKRWNDFKKQTETTNNRRLCGNFIENNNGYTYLERVEGGLDLNGKQLRFRIDYNQSLDNDIKIYVSENWTFNELDNILGSFLEIFHEIYSLDGIRGVIELEPI